MKNNFAIILIAVSILVFSATPVFAAGMLVYDNSIGDNNWFNGYNWSGGVPPGSLDSAEVGLAGSFPDINITSPVQIDFLHLGGNNTINVVGTTFGVGTGFFVGGITGISSFNISNGSIVVFDTGSVSNGTGQANIMIRGAGSKLAGHVFTIGNDLYGTVTVADGGELNMGVAGDGTGIVNLGHLGFGVLKVGNGGAHGIVNAAEIHAESSIVDFDFTDNYTFGSVISGSGLVIKHSSGVLTLSGANTYTLGTTIFDGTVVLANAHALGTGRVIMASDTILKPAINNMIVANDFFIACSCAPAAIDTQAFDMTLSGEISGSGHLRKDGSGTLIYDGNGNAFSGFITVANGTFKIGSDEAHASAITGGAMDILAPATFSGHGTFNGNVVNSGTVSPGGSIGTLNVFGNYTQNSTGTLAINVSPSAASVLAVGADAGLSGTLRVIFEPGVYAPKKYTFLTARGVGPSGAISGAFTNVLFGQIPMDDDVGLTISNLIYTPFTVSFALSGSISGRPSNLSSFTGLTSTTIQSSIRSGNIIFDQLAADINNSNDQILALGFSSIGNSQIIHAENAAGINDLVHALPNVLKEKGGWFKAYGNLGSVDSNSSSVGYSNQAGGFLFGVDQFITKTFRVGVAGGYEHTDVHGFSATKSKGAADTMRFALYGRQMVFDDIAFDAQASYALHMFDNQRFVAVAGSDATSEHNGHEFSGTVQLAKSMRASSFKLTPRAGLHFTHLYEEGFSESGAGAFNATFAEHDTDSLQLFTGFAVVVPTQDIRGYFITPEAHIKYSYEVLDASRKASGTVGASSFSASGISAAKNTVSLGTSVSAKLDDIMDGFFSYDVSLPTSDNFDQTFALGVKIKF